MPLYEHKSHSEFVRTVPESSEDRRLSESPDWTLVPPAKPAKPAKPPQE
jgi:hypothetical protein